MCMFVIVNEFPVELIRSFLFHTFSFSLFLLSSIFSLSPSFSLCIVFLSGNFPSLFLIQNHQLIRWHSFRTTIQFNGTLFPSSYTCVLSCPPIIYFLSLSLTIFHPFFQFRFFLSLTHSLLSPFFLIESSESLHTEWELFAANRSFPLFLYFRNRFVPVGNEEEKEREQEKKRKKGRKREQEKSERKGERGGE